MTNAYPISVLLAHATVLVVGGGQVATRKVKDLLACEAHVIVVAPQASSTIVNLAQSNLCEWMQKPYDALDLDGATLVFACTNNSGVNTRVYKDATRRQLLVNVVDCPKLCSFYVPSVLRRGQLSIAVSTEGSSPLTARMIRQSLEDQFPEEIALYLELLQSWREKVTTTLPQDKRVLFWQRATEGAVYELTLQGRVPEAQEALAILYDELASS